MAWPAYILPQPSVHRPAEQSEGQCKDTEGPDFISGEEQPFTMIRLYQERCSTYSQACLITCMCCHHFFLFYLRHGWWEGQVGQSLCKTIRQFLEWFTIELTQQFLLLSIHPGHRNTQKPVQECSQQNVH